jgi:hypothetical protein
VGNDTDRRDVRRDRRAAEDYVRRLVDAAPPLTAEQRDRLAVLLRSTPGRSDDANAGKPQPQAS